MCRGIRSTWRAHAQLLESIGLQDRNGNGVVEDKAGTEARFTVITQQGIGYYERGTTVLREQAAAVGIALDIVPLEFSAMVTRLLACDYDAIYMRPLTTDLDPAGNLDYWLSSGSAHLWNMQQKTPATDWEQRIDTLMHEQSTASISSAGRRSSPRCRRCSPKTCPSSISHRRGSTTRTAAGCVAWCHRSCVRRSCGTPTRSASRAPR